MLLVFDLWLVMKLGMTHYVCLFGLMLLSLIFGLFCALPGVWLEAG